MAQADGLYAFSAIWYGNVLMLPAGAKRKKVRQFVFVLSLSSVLWRVMSDSVSGEMSDGRPMIVPCALSAYCHVEL